MAACQYRLSYPEILGYTIGKGQLRWKIYDSNLFQRRALSDLQPGAAAAGEKGFYRNTAW
jgi:hypothetical protein